MLVGSNATHAGRSKYWGALVGQRPQESHPSGINYPKIMVKYGIIMDKLWINFGQIMQDS